MRGCPLFCIGSTTYNLPLYVAIGRGEAGSPVKMGGAGAGLVPRLRPQTSTAEEGGQGSSQRLQSKLSGLQSELERTRRQLATEREEFHLKEAQIEASLNTAHKANQELEVPLSPTPSPSPSFLPLSSILLCLQFSFLTHSL